MHAQYRSGEDGFKAGGEFLSTPLPKTEKHEAAGLRKRHMLLDGLALAIFCPATYCAAARVLGVYWCDGDFATAMSGIAGLDSGGQDHRRSIRSHGYPDRHELRQSLPRSVATSELSRRDNEEAIQVPDQQLHASDTHHRADIYKSRWQVELLPGSDGSSWESDVGRA
jgi:hypothetical protein